IDGVRSSSRLKLLPCHCETGSSTTTDNEHCFGIYGDIVAIYNDAARICNRQDGLRGCNTSTERGRARVVFVLAHSRNNHHLDAQEPTGIEYPVPGVVLTVRRRGVDAGASRPEFLRAVDESLI